MKIFKEEEDSFTFILAPLIDVMLFILIFFMLSYSQSSIFQDISLPSSKSSGQSLEQESLWILDYDKEGAFLLDGKPISIQVLSQSLSSSGESKSLVLRADKELPYQKIVDIMDIIKQAGINKIYLAMQK